MSDRNKEEGPHHLDIAALDTYMLLSLFASILTTKAWQHLGLRVKPGTDKAEKDLDRARVAIDCVSFLIDKLEKHLTEKEKNEMRRVVTDLQINFARLSPEK